MGTSFDLDLRIPVAPLDVDPGAHITFTGVFHSSFDGSDLDAATTTWPGSAPGGASVDAGGLVDFAAGGLRIVSRDPDKHLVEAVATGDVGRACAAAHIASPCIVLRTRPEATTRLVSESEWLHSLVGRLRVEGTTLAPAEEMHERPLVPPFARVVGAVLVALALVWVTAACVMALRQYRESPARKLRATLARVEAKLGKADPALSAALSVPVAVARDIIDRKAVAARSDQGRRIQAALTHVDRRLSEESEREVELREKKEADALLAEMRTALDAAEEAMTAAQEVDDAESQALVNRV